MNLPNSKADAERDFWNEVEELLTGKYRRGHEQAERGIEAYKSARRLNDTDEIAEAVYNQGEEKAAEVIDGFIHSELPKGQKLAYA